MTQMFCYAGHFEQYFAMIHSLFVQLQIPKYDIDNQGKIKCCS